jgi:hypothetical protein
LTLLEEVVEPGKGIGLHLTFGSPQTINAVLAGTCGGAQCNLMDLSVVDVVMLKIPPEILALIRSWLESQRDRTSARAGRDRIV